MYSWIVSWCVIACLDTTFCYQQFDNSWDAHCFYGAIEHEDCSMLDSVYVGGSAKLYFWNDSTESIDYLR